MSERNRADLPREGQIDEFEPVRYHIGDTNSVLHRWRQLIRTISPRGWNAVQEQAPKIMQLIADSRVLYQAALALRSGGPKAPGPNQLQLEWLDKYAIWQMCGVLSRAIKSGRYKPGTERVVWVKKGSGKGKRPIVLMDVQDRVVQKAASLVLQPMLDPIFDPLSFAYRPLRSREQAIEVAQKLANGGYHYWLTHDLKNAFCRVPVCRLLDVFFKHLPCMKLRNFLKLILPPQSPKLTGIKQGGPLSPLALELYLNHFLDRPWRNAGHNVRIIRYADDLLVVAPDENTARVADLALREMLIPTGMILKHSFDETGNDIRINETNWLGFKFRHNSKKFQIQLGERAFEKLGMRFVLAHSKCRSSERANHILKQWVAQFGPCYRWEDTHAVCDRALETARSFGFEELISASWLLEIWQSAADCWKKTRQLVRRNPGYLVTGPLEFPTPTSVV